MRMVQVIYTQCRYERDTKDMYVCMSVCVYVFVDKASAQCLQLHVEVLERLIPPRRQNNQLYIHTNSHLPPFPLLHNLVTRTPSQIHCAMEMPVLRSLAFIA